MLVLEVGVVVPVGEQGGLLLAGARRRHWFEVIVPVDVLLHGLADVGMLAHSADVPSAVFKYVVTSSNGLAVSTVRDALVFDAQVSDLGKEALLRAHAELLVVEEGGGVVANAEDGLVTILEARHVAEERGVGHVYL